MNHPLIIIKHYIIWFALSMAFYFYYISSMAKALGIPNRAWVKNDWIEGSSISLVAAVVLTLLSWSIAVLVNRLVKNQNAINK